MTSPCLVLERVHCFMKDVFVVGRAVAPVMHYVLERHASAHEELVLPPGGYKQCELYKNCCSK